MMKSTAQPPRPRGRGAEHRGRRSRFGSRKRWASGGRLGDDLESGGGQEGPAQEADGFVGGFEGLLFGFLLFVAGTLLISYAWAVVDTKAATEEAARQAARTYVEAASATVASSSARSAVDAALAGYGRNPNRATVDVAVGTFGRCERVTISVEYPAPLLALPFVGRVGTGHLVRADHSELVDPYRTGLPGTAECG